MRALDVAVVSITTTKRRRFLWCAWWTSPPSREPFRAPDVWAGGARSIEEARADAERVAGRSLVLVESSFARAFTRVRAGLPPWPARAGDATPRGVELPPESALAILGLPRGATHDDIKRAYRQRALETHPDRGGDAREFVRVQRAYESATKRAARPRRRSR